MNLRAPGRSPWYSGAPVAKLRPACQKTWKSPPTPSRFPRSMAITTATTHTPAARASVPAVQRRPPTRRREWAATGPQCHAAIRGRLGRRHAGPDGPRAGATSDRIAGTLAKIQGREDGQAPGRLRDYLPPVRQRLPDDEALLVIDAGGRVVTSSSGRTGGVRLPPDGLNRLRTGDALVGDAYWDGALGKAAIVLAVPVRQADGRFLGAFTAKLNLRPVPERLQRLPPCQ